MAAGGFFGSLLGLSSVAVYFCLLFYGTEPHLLYDGHGSLFLIVCFFHAPLGAWLGATTGSVFAGARRGSLREAAWVCVVGVLVFLLVPVTFVIMDPFHEYSFEPSERWSQLAFYFGGELFWSGLLLLWAYRLWTRSRPPHTRPTTP